jgi:hypothetical protein
MSSVFVTSGRAMGFGAFTKVPYNPNAAIGTSSVVPTFQSPVPGSDDSSTMQSTLMRATTVNTEPSLDVPVDGPTGTALSDSGTVSGEAVADTLGDGTTWSVPVPASSSSFLPLLALAVAVGGYFFFKKKEPTT